MKLYLLERGLRPRINFRKANRVKDPRTLYEFLNFKKTYIRYEEKLSADDSRKSRIMDPQVESFRRPYTDKHKEERPINDN